MQDETIEYINKLVPLFDQIGSLTEDVAAIVKEAKDKGLDGATIGKVAKAKSNQKLGDLEDKTNALLDVIAKVNS